MASMIAAAASVSLRQDCARRLHRECADEDGQSTQDELLDLRKLGIAPVESGAESPVPRQGRAAALHQQLEAIVESRGQSCHAEGVDAACRYFDREGNSVEPATDLRHEGASASASSNDPRLAAARSTKSWTAGKLMASAALRLSVSEGKASVGSL